MKELTDEYQIADDLTEGLRLRAITATCSSWLLARTVQTHQFLQNYLPPHTPDAIHIAEAGYAAGSIGAAVLAASHVRQDEVMRFPTRSVALACGISTLAANITARVGVQADLNHASAVATGSLLATAYLLPHYARARRAQRMLRDSLLEC